MSLPYFDVLDVYFELRYLEWVIIVLTISQSMFYLDGENRILKVQKNETLRGTVKFY